MIAPSRPARLLVAAALVAALGAACTPAPPTDVVVRVSPGSVPSPVTVQAGQKVTVIGTGFTTTGNLGVRPPLASSPAGVYAVWGRFADTWKPSAGAPSSARQIIQQVWALPSASFDRLGGLDGLVRMGPDGSFTAELTITEASGTNANYGIGIYPGSGAVNPAEELFVPVTITG